MHGAGKKPQKKHMAVDIKPSNCCVTNTHFHRLKTQFFPSFSLKLLGLKMLHNTKKWIWTKWQMASKFHVSIIQTSWNIFNTNSHSHLSDQESNKYKLHKNLQNSEDGKYYHNNTPYYPKLARVSLVSSPNLGQAKNVPLKVAIHVHVTSV
jgi:hypothetical protein